MSWTKKDAPETSALPAGVNLSGLNAPAPEPAKARGVPQEMLTPAAQAYTASMVREAIAGMFEQLAPLLSGIALTPEKIELMEKARRAPTADQITAAARNAREKLMMIQEQKENAANLIRQQSACPHRYPTGQLAINLVRNFPDRNVRGVCSLCNCWIHPREWRIGPASDEFPRGAEYIVAEHPQYGMVREALVIKG
jgi:hypothetical protein